MLNPKIQPERTEDGIRCLTIGGVTEKQFTKHLCSDVSCDVTPRSRGVVYFYGWQKHSLLRSRFLGCHATLTPPETAAEGTSENTTWLDVSF